ncbi:MAG: tetratricopeptide repeat protein [Planctomycetes bacterium]|nr:tetratricopeptide repeat protein [Planctomycetota bacterium]
MLVLLLLRFWWSSRQKPEKEDHTFNAQEGQLDLPVYKPVGSEKEVAALKKEELRLGQQLLRDFPGRVDALIKMADILRRNGDAVEALVFLQKALKVNPSRADIYTRIAQLSEEKGELEEALAQYSQALRLQPRMPKVLSKMANIFMILGKNEEAIAALTKEIQFWPTNSYAYLLLGQAFLQQKEYQKAGESYAKAIKIKPNYAKAYYGLARIQSQLGNHAQARTYSERFRQLKAEERIGLKSRKMRYDDFVMSKKRAAITHLEIGRMYRDQGKMPEAEKLLKHAVGLDPNNTVCLFELAALYNTHGAPEKALQLFKKMAQTQPDYPMSYYMMGILHAHLGHFDEAETAFNTMIRLIPQTADGYRELARLYLKNDRKIAQARQLAEKALTLQASAASYFIYGWACDENGDTANALPAIKRAVELEPTKQQYQDLYKEIQQRK